MTVDAAIRIDLHSAEVVHFTHKIRFPQRRDICPIIHGGMKRRVPELNLPDVLLNMMHLPVIYARLTCHIARSIRRTAQIRSGVLGVNTVVDSCLAWNTIPYEVINTAIDVPSNSSHEYVRGVPIFGLTI
jgi:hypothetical protein